MKLITHTEMWPTTAPFRITGYTMLGFSGVVVELTDEGHTGVGEAYGVYYCDETAESMMTQIETYRAAIESGLTREELLELMPTGGARNAVDAALWDLEAKKSGISAWAAAGVEENPVTTVFTLGIEETAEAMGAKAAETANFAPMLKIKLDNVLPVERITAIRNARPDATIVVDVNQGWNFSELKEYAPKFADLGIDMLEQPLPRGGDAELEGYNPPLPIYADESCLNLSELEQACQRYQGINIKLDKAGGLTESLLLADKAIEAGKLLMVGCMGGTSQAMAPAHVMAQRCALVDIDGPLLLRNDRRGGLEYNNGIVSVPQGTFWGRR